MNAYRKSGIRINMGISTNKQGGDGVQKTKTSDTIFAKS